MHVASPCGLQKPVQKILRLLPDFWRQFPVSAEICPTTRRCGLANSHFLNDLTLQRGRNWAAFAAQVPEPSPENLRLRPHRHVQLPRKMVLSLVTANPPWTGSTVLLSVRTIRPRTWIRTGGAFWRNGGKATSMFTEAFSGGKTIE